MVTPLLAKPASSRRPRLRWLLAALALAALAWLGAHLSRDFQYRAQHVVVEHVGDSLAPHCSAAELRHLADVRFGTPIWMVDLQRVVDGVMQHPWVVSVEAARRWPDTVVIRVREHVPVLLLQHRGLYYVDERGEVFKRARNSDLDYPLLTGLTPELTEQRPQVAQRVVREALALLADVESSVELSGDDLSEIRFHEQDGFTLVLRSGSEVALGFAEPASRLDRLTRLRQQGLDASSPQRIDLAPESIALVTPLASATELE